MARINQLKASVIITYLNMLISFIIPFIYTPVMLEILGQKEYGVYSLANSVISYLSLLNLGMGQAIIKYISFYRAKKDNEKINGALSLFVVLYLILAVLVIIIGIIIYFGAASWFAKGLSINEIDTLKSLIIVMTISTAISLVSSVFSATTTAFEKYIYRKIIETISTILAPVLNIVILLLGYKSIGLAVMGLAMSICLCVLYMVYDFCILKVRIKYKNIPFNMLKEVFEFSIFVFISSLVDMLYWSTDKVLIGALVGSTGVAIYNVGGTFTNIYQNIAGAIGNVFGPRVNRFVALGENDDTYSELLIRIGRIQYYLVALVLSGYIVFGKQFIHFWAGDGYMQAYYIAILTMVPLAVPLIQNIALTTAVAKNKHRFRAVIYLVIAIVNVVSTYFVIPIYGIIGAAICTCISYLIGNGLIMNFYYYKVLNFKISLFWKNIIHISKVPILMMIICYFIFSRVIVIHSLKQFILYVMIYSIVYFILLWKFSMNEYEKDLISEMVKQFKNKIFITNKKNN